MISKKGTKLIPDEIVVLHWEDSRGGTEWISKRDYKPHTAKVVSVGMLVAETDECVTITCSMTKEDDGYYYAPITVPKSCIMDRRTLS